MLLDIWDSSTEHVDGKATSGKNNTVKFLGWSPELIHSPSSRDLPLVYNKNPAVLPLLLSYGQRPNVTEN
jgi:hypothetical protein